MTRVLYIVDEAYPTTSANGRIVYRIIDELIKHPDISVTILARAKTEEQLQQTEYHGCRIIHTPNIYATAAEQLNLRLGKRKWLRYILNPRTIYYRLSGESNYYMAEAKLWIKRHLNVFDVIVANSMPFYPLEIASKFGDVKPVVLYKMEPVAHYVHHGDFEQGKQTEEAWDNSASAIIMEGLIHKFYRQYASKENLSKTTIAGFPCIIKREQREVEHRLPKNKINLVYVGKFYYQKRDPRYLFALMDRLHEKGIQLTIAGGYYYSGLPTEVISKYFTNRIPYITYLGELPADQADALLNEADVLVHLGNSISDQMPSKILDYISSGKPILNIYGIDDCPTLPYLEHYPLAMNIKDGTEITDDLIARITQFISQSKGKQILFEQIETIYKECTPEYVGQQFYEVIRSLVNNKTKL